jgi:hypothetical protein
MPQNWRLTTAVCLIPRLLLLAAHPGRGDPAVEFADRARADALLAELASLRLRGGGGPAELAVQSGTSAAGDCRWPLNASTGPACTQNWEASQSTSAYHSLVEVEPNVALITYDQLAFGWGFPPGPRHKVDTVFAMRIRVGAASQVASVGGEAAERTISGHAHAHDSDSAALGRINTKTDDTSHLGLLMLLAGVPAALPVPRLPLQAALTPSRGTSIISANWTVVYPTEPNCWEVTAAETLAAEILAATNLTLRVLPETGCPSCGHKGLHSIYVGHTLRLQAVGQPQPPLAAEEAMYFVQGGDLFIFGDDVGTPIQKGVRPNVCASQLGSVPSCVGGMFGSATCRTGTLYAAYRFCHEQLGVRWLWPGADGTSRRPGQEVQLPAQLRVRSAPQIRLRQVRPNPAETTAAELAADLPDLYDGEVAEKIRWAEHEWYLKMGLGKTQDLPP